MRMLILVALIAINLYADNSKGSGCNIYEVFNEEKETLWIRQV